VGLLWLTAERGDSQERPRDSNEAGPVLVVEPAEEPRPALRYRFYPAKQDLRPTSAMLFFARAAILFQERPEESREKWGSPEWQEKGHPDGPSDEELAQAVSQLELVFNELHTLAMSEDLSWGDRMRDLRGFDSFSYMLPAVPKARRLAEVLRLKVRHQLNGRDFNAAIVSIQSGIRLAEFVGQGEINIHHLVAIRCAEEMQASIREAISTSGCPNLYWALASIPRPLISTTDCIQWESTDLGRIVPALEDARTEQWTPDTAERKWTQVWNDLARFSNLTLSLSVTGEILNDPHDSPSSPDSLIEQRSPAARSRLIAAGISEERLDAMPIKQMLLADASYIFQEIVEDHAKGFLLPPAIGNSVRDAAEGRLEGLLKRGQEASFGTMIARKLLPASIQAERAELTINMRHHRLMTVEAIRMHAAEHRGEFPKHLNSLHLVPAMFDPYNSKPFDYDIASGNGVQTAPLSATRSHYRSEDQDLTIQVKTGSNR